MNTLERDITNCQQRIEQAVQTHTSLFTTRQQKMEETKVKHWVIWLIQGGLVYVVLTVFDFSITVIPNTEHLAEIVDFIS